MARMSDMMREIRGLSVEDRIELADAIWDSVEEDCEDSGGLTDAQKREIDRCLAAYEADPDDVIPWETVRRKLASPSAPRGGVESSYSESSITVAPPAFGDGAGDAIAKRKHGGAKMAQTPDMMREIRGLSVEDRIDLADAVWDSAEEDQEEYELTDAEKRELERRLAACEASGYKGDSWEKVVERIRAKK